MVPSELHNGWRTAAGERLGKWVPESLEAYD